MKPLVAVFALVLALALIPFALDWRSPFLVDMRPWLFRGLIVISSSLMLAQFCVMRTSRPGQLVIGVISATGLVAAGVVLISTLALEGRFHWVRHHVLRADPGQLERLGRHFIVGYRDLSEVRELVKLRAVAGVFLCLFAIVCG